MWNLYIIFGIFCNVYLSNSENVLVNKSPPTLIKELQHLKFFNQEVVKLKCTINGNPSPSYQWYISTSEVIDLSVSMQEIQFEKVINGNEYTLEIDGAKSPKKFSKYAYYCVAQSPLGSLLSNKIIIEKVIRPEKVSVTYTPYNVKAGEKYVIQCSVSPDLWLGLFKFKWWEVRLKAGNILYLNKTEGRYSVITYTKSPELHIRNVTLEDFAKTKVRCIVKSTVHNDSTESMGHFVAVEKVNYESPEYLVNKCGNAETITASVGTNIELPWCSIPKTLDISWYKMDNFNVKIQIANNSDDHKYKKVSLRFGNLLIINATKEDSGKYMAVTINKSPLITLIHTVTIYEPAAVTLTPNYVEKMLSDVAEFVCSATYSKCQFYWLHNGQKVTSGYDDHNIDITNHNKQSILRIKKVRLSVTGIYQCIAAADNELKAITEFRQSSSALYISKVPPFLYKQSPRVERDTITAQIQMSSIQKIKTIECIFSANPRPNIDWYLDSKKVPIKSVFSISIQEDSVSVYNFIAKLTINLDELNFGDNIREYAGEYQAVAKNILGTASCKTFVLMDGPLELRLPATQTAVGGKDFVLTCYFVAMGVPEFSWERQPALLGVWESLPSNHRTVMRDRNHILLLMNVIKVEDEGTYRCITKFNGETKNSTTYLQVANPPNLQNLPARQDISESNYHICTVNNKADQPWYVWWTFTKYNSNETIELRPDHPSTIHDFSVKYDTIASNSRGIAVKGIPPFLFNYANKGVNLRIKERLYEKSSLGKFTCHAKNHIDYTEMTIEDNFLSLEFKDVPPSTSEVVVGSNLYLNCTAKESDLDPYTKWRISTGDKIYIDINDMKDKYEGRIYQFNNGTLVMTNIRESDPSTLYCFIIPSKKNFEVQSKVAYIDIRIPARVRTMKKEIYKVADTAFNLSCNIYGHTKDLLVTWFHYVNDEWKNLSQTCIYSRENHCINEYQSGSKKSHIITDSHSLKNHTVHLEFRDVVKSIAGLYKCKAKNKFNKISSESSTNLTIISKPSKIENLEKSSASSTDISFQWEPPRDDGNRPILFYEIQYSELHRNFTKKNIAPITFRVNSTTLFKMLNNLRPFRTYEISIIAVNEVGKSEATLINLTTEEALPEKPVRNLKARSPQPHEILITWDEPEIQYQNGKIIYYELCYQIMPTIEDSGNIHVSQLTWSEKVKKSDNSKVNCQKTKESMVNVPNLPQFTDFGIEIIAYNTKGNSPPAYTKVRTLEDLPQASPTHLTCSPMQQTIRLTWNSPGRQTINGVLIGYVVHYYKPNKYGDESNMTSINVQGTTTVLLDMLESDTGYSIQVMAANRKGLGPPSTRIICTTEEAKPEAPDDAKAVKFNSTCMAVSWLHVSRPHGKIREYCILWLGYSNDRPKCQPPNYKKRYNYMILCDRFNQNSRLKVFARNRHDGASKEVNIKEYNGIISIGGHMEKNEGTSALLLCETSIDESLNVVWKKDGRRINNNENPNLKIYSNNSLEIKSLEKYVRQSYSCSTEYDSIEYNIDVLEIPSGFPRPPIINDIRLTENSIFVSWTSRGSRDISAPITGFSLTWENLYSGESKTISLDGNIRTYYLNNATCASDFIVKIRSINALGPSHEYSTKKVKTLGTIPQIADSSVLLPLSNIKSNSVYFNLNAFGPGDNCSAIYFFIDISLTSMGHNYHSSIITKNITIYELENKCCYKVANLNPLTLYKYQINAYNAAGFQMSYNTFKTIGINNGNSNSKHITVSTENPLNHSWLLMIILIIAVIFIMVFLVLGVLYIFRSKDQRSQSNAGTLPIRKPEFNQPRVDRPNIHEDTTSMDSNGEPSPYAVYQPDNDPKTNHMWTQQVSQTSSTPGYNYPEHLYNQIRYDKIHQFTRPMTENQDHVRRVNSAECLSSVGNASISGIADLESPSNIDPSNRILHGPYGRSSTNDDVFQNIQFPSCSTVNRQIKRVRRDSENLRYNDEERIKLVHQNQPMVINWRNDPISYRSQQPLVYNKIGNPNMRIQYRQQMSVPEPMTVSAQQHGYTTNRIRTQSGVGSSQAIIPNSSTQITPCSNYYETHCSQIYPNAKRDNPNSVINASNDPFPKYIATNHQSNYAPQQRATGPRQDFKTTNGNVPRSSRNECSDDEIYTDRVVVV